MARHKKRAHCLSRVDLLRQRERFAGFRAFPSWFTHNRREPTRVLLNDPSVSVNSRGSVSWKKVGWQWLAMVVIFVETDAGDPVIVQRWVPAESVRPVPADPNRAFGNR